jgi:hypothetical protein
VAQADSDHITSRPIPLSRLFDDQFLRDAFRRAEDSGLDFSIAALPVPPRTLDGGAVVRIAELVS